MKKQLYLVTETFPYGTGEKTFILPELAELIKNYDVTIISHASKQVCEDKGNETKLDDGIKVVNIDINLKWYKKILYFVKFFIDSDGIRELNYILKEKENIFSRIYQSVGFYALAMENFRLMKKNNLLCTNKEVICYTYWYYYYTYSFTKYKKQFPKMRLFTRTHGFDLYADRYKGMRQPFKEIMDIRLDKIFFISMQGKEYYLKKYGFTDNNKYVVSRLGTIGTKTKGKPLKDSGKKFRLVSCSSIISLKRVDLIIKALSILDEPIEWIHFGAGHDCDKVGALSKKVLDAKENISYRFMGFVDNESILEYYSENYVNCFISTSSSEGVPVSIQEAMSFGIPIIATDVGGVSELVEDNGILLKANPSKEDVASAIKEIIYVNENEYISLRENSYKIWQERYNAEVNRMNFVKMLED